MAGGAEMSPGRPDRAVIARHLGAMRRALAALRRHAGVSAAELRDDSDRLRAVERYLQLCAQNALDIASHIESSAGRAPENYRAAIERLAEAGALPSGFAARFCAIAGFRNVLVQGYLEVDIALVVRFLTERLEDFEEFARHVERWLEESPGS